MTHGEVDSDRGTLYSCGVPETTATTSDAIAHIASLEESLVAAHAASAKAYEAFAAERKRLQARLDDYKKLYETTLQKLELLERRLSVAKAERIDVKQLELEFATVKAELEALQKLGADEETQGADAAEPAPPPPGAPPPKAKPKERRPRDLETTEMPEERIELLDPELEQFGLRIKFEESFRIGHRRAGPVRIVLARALYRVPAKDVAAEPIMVTAPLPPELFRRSMVAPSLIAHILVSKYAYGLPFNRLCEMLGHQGIHLDRSTLCRIAENSGATFGVIVDAMASEAITTALCLSTDATGCAIQPERVQGKRRQPCRKGHFVVVLADQDHVFFEYQTKQTSDAVCSMFKGFSGYIQADASAVYDALFRGKGEPLFENEDTPKPPTEVGCWAHARRRFWDAATAAKDPRAREGLLRIRMFYEAEARWAALPPSKRKEMRDSHTRPLVDAFFVWAKAIFEDVKSTRSFVTTAFGYAVRQERALRTFLEDGRLRLDNNHSERGLRPIAVGRKAWLFFGSDDHAAAAANLFSLIASCKLHGIEPEGYFAELIRVMPVWPNDRYLELAPKYWKTTRARLQENELVAEYGFTTVPPRLAAKE
jgi:transposase